MNKEQSQQMFGVDSISDWLDGISCEHRNAKGEECWMNLNEIYDRATKHFNVPRESITAAEY